METIPKNIVPGWEDVNALFRVDCNRFTYHVCVGSEFQEVYRTYENDGTCEEEDGETTNVWPTNQTQPSLFEMLVANRSDTNIRERYLPRWVRHAPEVQRKSNALMSATGQ